MWISFRCKLGGKVDQFWMQINKRFGLKVDFQEFAICLHSYSFHKRGITKEQYYTINDVQKIPGIVDSRQCDFLLSLLIKVNYLELDKEHILACLPQKLCGGAVHIGLPNLSSVDVYNDFKHAVEAIPLTKGKWLAIDDSNNPFNNVFDMMSKIEKRDDLVAGCVGYHFLELPEDKIGSLDNIQHVFAEPILAAVRMSSFVFGDTHEKLIWQYQKNSTSLYLTN
ncbi:hypothetical protein AX660_16715 [Paraglaciecola hydrolytica]|uniref:Uncharacterized protein n=2 Tax=Paraglaciecola hydrolytica TaxID=1799789 RepID=A0A135ZYH2_9ALTE|nr:hypothetical protein AX660_16715 [Paraglaciecola hydrolytica]